MERRAFVVGLGTALGVGAAGAEIEAAAVERAIADAEPGTVLELRPGDVVVLRLPEGVDLSGAEMEALGRRAGDAFGVDAVVVPLPPYVDLNEITRQ